MNISIINGPNLNLLGKREPDIYGNHSFESFFAELQGRYKKVTLSYLQSNSETAIIDRLQKDGYTADGILLNAAAYTHTSVAIRDAIAAIPTDVLEIHISNIFAREEFRHKTLIGPVCKGSISGLGFLGYQLGIEYFLNHVKKK